MRGMMVQDFGCYWAGTRGPLDWCRPCVQVQLLVMSGAWEVEEGEERAT